MSNLAIGFVSSLIGFLVSPQLKFANRITDEIYPIILYSIVIGASLGASSQINGHNIKMLIKSKVDFIVNLFSAGFLGCLIGFFFLYLLKYYFVGRWVFLITLTSYMVLIFAFNLYRIKIRNHRVLVLGSGANDFGTVLRELGSGRLVEMFVCVEAPLVSSVLERIVTSEEYSEKYYVTSGNISVPASDRDVGRCDTTILANLFSVESLIESELGVVPLNTLGSERWWSLPTKLRQNGYALFKRALDILLAALLCVAFAPVFVVAVIAIKLFDRGPILYRQIRSGQYGKPFSVFKIRTMRVDSEQAGPKWANVNDSRVTRIGKLLRSSRIDELPQLWNIIIGDMSLIGPRPERPEFYAMLERELPGFSLRLCCKPGLTGWAQVNYPYGASVQDSKVKLMYDLYYIKRADFVLDVRILTRTVVAMVKGAR
jgi:exopolysaccharide biosynthesis polyprenyl glycosylphosphotransferase